MIVTERIDEAIAMLAEAKGLSRAETAVLELATAGVDSHAKLAKARNVERSTIKKQIQRLLAKTGFRSLDKLTIAVLLVALARAYESPP